MYEINILSFLAKRRSARACSSRHVERSKLLSIFEAARWPAPRRNEQPWRYIVFTNEIPIKLRKVQQSVIKDRNDYAKRASILICVIIKKTYSANGNYNRLLFHGLGGAIQMC